MARSIHGRASHVFSQLEFKLQLVLPEVTFQQRSDRKQPEG